MLIRFKKAFFVFILSFLLASCKTTQTQEQNIVNTSLKDVNPTSKVSNNESNKALSLSEQEYEETLTTKAVNFSPSPNQPTVFPVKSIALQLNDFYELPKIEVYAAPEINFGLGAYASVHITQVLNKKDNDICDCDSENKQENIKEIFNNFIKKQENSLNGNRDFFIKGKKTDIKTVTGVIRLYLPVNIKTITLSKKDVGQTIEISPNLNIRVDYIGHNAETLSNGLGIEVIGKGRDLLLKNFYAYDEKGNLLEQPTSGRNGRYYFWGVEGTPTTVELNVAEKIITKEYPFTLNK